MSNVATSHRIRKLCWQVTTAFEEGAFSLRRDLRKQWEVLAVAVFEEALDAACGKDQVIHIHKITLQLNIDSEKDLAIQLPGQLHEALKQTLQDHQLSPDLKASSLLSEGFELPNDSQSISEYRSPEKDLAIQLPGQLHETLKKMLQDHQLSPDSKTSSPLSERFEVPDDSQSISECLSEFSSEAEDHFATFMTYLQTGIVSWHMAHLPASEMTSHFKTVLSSDQKRLFTTLNKKPAELVFYFRLLQLYSDEEIVPFIQDLSKSHPEICSAFCAQALTLLFRPSQDPLSRHSLLRLAAAFLSEGHQVGSPALPHFSALAAKVLSKADRLIFEKSVSKLPSKSARLFFDGEEIDDRPSEKRRGSGTALFSPESSVISPDRDQVEKVSLLSRINLKNNDNSASEQGFSTLNVKHAGLILLHPFLSGLFKHCAVITDDPKTLSPVALPKAAALLHFLATGLENIYEYELGLIKVLLGLHPEMPLLVSEGLLKEADKKEALALLEAAIQHWSILKKTSVDGLRTTFLDRQGLLKKEDVAWRLHIERKPFDVLLDQLPWSMNIVKLPWMKQALYTEW